MTPSKRDRVLSAAEGFCAAISKPHQESFLPRTTEKLSQGSQDSLRGVTNPFRKSLGTNDLFQESQKYYSLRGAYDLFRESQNSLRRAYKLNLFRESQHSLRGANNLFLESQTSLWGACYLFRESQNSLRGTNSKLFWEAYKSNNGSKISRLRETNTCVNACETASRDSECNDIIYTDYKTYLKRVDSCEPKIPHCVKNHRHSRLCSKIVTRRVRDREPSRVPLKKVIQSLNCKKLRKKRKKMLQKTVPVSSVLHSITANYKLWKTRFILRDDSFYTYYLKSTKKSKMICNSSEQNILLSGDVELNPGPATGENTSAVCSSDPNFLLECRMIRYGLTPLDVGGGGDCFFKSVSHQLCGDSSHHLELRAT